MIAGGPYTKTISFLIPTYNEEENVKPLSEAIIQQISTYDYYDYEIIFIDNDSSDDTRKILREMCSENNRIKAIFNAKNYGQFSSPFYGILQINGDCAITLCADFQDPVEMIPKFIDEWEKGSKIVLGQKVSSKENKLIYAARSSFYWFMGKFSSIDYLKQVTGFGLYDRSFIDMLKTIDEPAPVMRALTAELGYQIKLIPYEQQKRRAGKSSNNIFRYYDAAVQNITGYTKIGVRLAMFIGIFSVLISMITCLCVGIYKIINWNSYSVSPFILPLIAITMLSFNILFVGIVGEYVLDVKTHVKRRPLVIESERINFD